jgi:restriction system protein
MAPSEVYQEILNRKLYEFHAQNPSHIVLTQIRRHCDGIDFPTAASVKHFVLVGDNRFWVLDSPKRVTGNQSFGRLPSRRQLRRSSLGGTLKELQRLHERYISFLKERIVFDLRRLSPPAFELFAKALMDVYGFEDMRVTKVSSDGGIDGHGKLRVGLAYLNVAFQCKRWTKGNVQRPEIDKFRGAIQGDFEQGIFFATTTFSQGAIDASIKRGAVPVVLIDNRAIVQMMIEKNFGVQAESLVIPTYALDLVLTPEDLKSSDGTSTIPSAVKSRGTLGDS